MAVAVIADAHLGGPGGGAAPLLAQLAGLPAAGCSRLILLGDLFHIWIGDRRFETPEVAKVAEALAGLGRQGVPIDYVEGNRDFFLGGSAYAGLFDRLGAEVGFTAGGRRVLAVHGDGLDASDRRYRFWRRLSKSPPVRLLVRGLPAGAAARLAAATERRLARTNFKHKVAIPEEVIRAYGGRRLAEGYDLLILGHFHEPRRWLVPGGEIRLLDAWFRSRAIEWF